MTVGFEVDAAGDCVPCPARVETAGRTGVEVEALTAVQVGLLTIYNMCKAVERRMVMSDVACWRSTALTAAPRGLTIRCGSGSSAAAPAPGQAVGNPPAPP